MKQTLLILVLVATTLFAVPAMPGKLTFKQNDGSVFVGELKGDEYFYWIETEDGYIVKYNKNSKEYEYMLLDAQDELVFSEIKVKSQEPKSSFIHLNSSQSTTTKTNISLPSNIKKIPSSTLGKIWKNKWKEKQLQRAKMRQKKE